VKFLAIKFKQDGIVFLKTINPEERYSRVPRQNAIVEYLDYSMIVKGNKEWNAFQLNHIRQNKEEDPF